MSRAKKFPINNSVIIPNLLLACARIMNKQEQKELFQQIIKQHKGILFNVTRVYCHNENDRDDLMQEMKIEIWQSVPRYKDQFKISTWLYRNSLNVAISFYRKNSTRANRFTVLNEQLSDLPNKEKAETEQQLSLLEQFFFIFLLYEKDE